jgi:hypothetical protein
MVMAQHPASVDAYIRHGWSLVPIPPGSKGPKLAGWNLRDAALRDQSELPTGFGIGLAHAYSGTMALDIDDWDATVAAGIDLDSLYAASDAVIIDSSRPGHGKLLYAMPKGMILPSKRISKEGKVAFELRCATSVGTTVQDVLPPSIHPLTNQPYRWSGKGRWQKTPLIPTFLLEMWQKLISADSLRVIHSGEAIQSSWADVQSALATIPPHCSREDWIVAGMALHFAGTQTDQIEQAFALWSHWSMQSPEKYPGDIAIAQQWRSFNADKTNKVRLGSLFHLAREHGWVRPPIDAAILFTALPPPSPPAEMNGSIYITPPEVDLTLFPSVLATRSQEISDAMGLDPVIPLFSGLGAVCGVADSRIRLELMPGYKVPPVLWLMVIGDPSDKKSPGSRPMLQTLKALEAEDRPRYEIEHLAWEAKEAAYSSAKKAFLEHAASPDALINGAAPIVPKLADEPVPVKIAISDVTSQKLVRVAAARPRGLLGYFDEMAAWCKSLTDKGTSENRSTWVVAYESESYAMDRVGAGSIYAENLAVSIFGCIQPRVFGKYLSEMSQDGLLQRFIPALTRERFNKVGEPIPEFMTTSTDWDQCLRIIYSLPAITYRLSPEAYSAFREFQHWYEQRKRDERLLMASETYMTAFGKLEGTTGRMILVFHLIENPYLTDITLSVAKRAIDFVMGYVVPALKFTLNGESASNQFDKWLADHIIQLCDTGTITLSDIKRSARRQLEGKSTWDADQVIIRSMTDLESAKWVIRLDDGSREHQHFAEWAINEKIATMFAPHKERVEDARRRVSNKFKK